MNAARVLTIIVSMHRDRRRYAMIGGPLPSLSSAIVSTFMANYKAFFSLHLVAYSVLSPSITLTTMTCVDVTSHYCNCLVIIVCGSVEYVLCIGSRLISSQTQQSCSERS